MAQSRLEKLINLLCEGTSNGIRRAAAKQIGSLASNRPLIDVVAFLQKLHPHLTAKLWDTRVAVAMALEHVFKNATAVLSKLDMSTSLSRDAGLDNFDLESILATQKPLLASTGGEYSQVLPPKSAAGYLLKQRAEMKQTLGIVKGMGMDDFANELVGDADLLAANEDCEGKAEVKIEEGLSARQKSALKRKAKLERQGRAKTFKELPQEQAETHNPAASSVVDDSSNPNPIALLLDEAIALLANPLWQSRHGGALCLRELLGCPLIIKSSNLSLIASRLLTTMALDRFGDFIGDQVTAPVRETCAQALGLCSRLLPAEQLAMLIEHLKNMSQNGLWQVRHAALLGLKYVLASKLEDLRPVLCSLATVLIDRISDPDEDVRATAASILILLVRQDMQMQAEGWKSLVQRAWDALGDLVDEISPSATQMLELLSVSVDNPTGMSAFQSVLTCEDPVLPLFPFFTHHSEQVRQESFRLLSLLLGIVSEPSTNITDKLLDIIWQTLLLESAASVVASALAAFSALLPHVSNTVVQKTLSKFIEILKTPIGTPFDARQFLRNESDIMLGFSMADMPMISEEQAMAGRKRAADHIRRLVVKFEDDPLIRNIYIERLWKPFGESTWAIHRLVAIWAYVPQLCREERKVDLSLGKTVFCEELQTQRTLAVLLESKLVRGFAGSFEEALEDILRLKTGELSAELLADIKKYMAAVFLARSRIRISALSLLTPSDAASGFQDLLLYMTNEQCPTLLRGAAQILSTLIVHDPPNGTLAVKYFIDHLDKTQEDKLDDAILSTRIFVEELLALAETSTELTLTIPCELLGDSRLVVGSARMLTATASCIPNAFLSERLSILLECLAAVRLSTLLTLDKIEACSRTFGVLAHCCPDKTLEYFILNLLPSLPSPDAVVRLYLLKIIESFIDQLGDTLVAYGTFFIVPTLGRMTDSDASIRSIAAVCFASLVKLVPLHSTDGHRFSAKLEMPYREARMFLEQLADPKSMEDYRPPVEICAQLRPYQQTGLNWLAFLNKYQLHGCLCDDMGLGKTLQTLAMVAGDCEATRKHGSHCLPSLVVCPSSLVTHWQHEAAIYTPSLSTLLIAGTAAERRQLYADSSSYSLVITSYDSIRYDAGLFAGRQWNYLVLDEGHIIKNPKTKLFTAIKALNAGHRLILSGTPIQNNVLELWALFDFLMPGFLGSEASFTERYAKIISAGRSAKASQRDFEESERRMAALHKQTLPFLLRRMKEEVLKELPPKIIQDIECEMSVVQRILLDDEKFQRQLRDQVSRLKDSDSSLNTKETRNQMRPPMHVFQALQYLRKICVHPRLVLENDHPMMSKISEELERQGLTLDDIEVSPKLKALKELLEECGIGVGADTNADLEEEETAGHRVLLFAQQKTTLDLIESHLFNRHMPSVTFLRLDGSIPPGDRFALVQRFNSDPTIEVLLLTTRVGGLGLNLTSADTVIFIEHDWNPQRDLQAMDRSHRLGQTRTVSVYRLLLKDSLEMEIMGLQRWKKRVAETIVTQQNTEIGAMDTGSLLDLFDGPGSSVKNHKAAEALPKGVSTTALPKWIEDLEDVNPEEDYAREFDVSKFLLQASTEPQ